MIALTCNDFYCDIQLVVIQRVNLGQNVLSWCRLIDCVFSAEKIPGVLRKGTNTISCVIHFVILHNAYFGKVKFELQYHDSLNFDHTLINFNVSVTGYCHRSESLFSYERNQQLNFLSYVWAIDCTVEHTTSQTTNLRSTSTLRTIMASSWSQKTISLQSRSRGMYSSLNDVYVLSILDMDIDLSFALFCWTY